MADGTLAVTAGAGTLLKVSGVDSGANLVQYVREIQADTMAAPGSWTVSTTASTSQIAADAQRTGVLMVNTATGRVYFRFDATAPTTTAYHWYLDSGERWEVPQAFCRLAVSMLGASGASGALIYTLGTKG